MKTRKLSVQSNIIAANPWPYVCKHPTHHNQNANLVFFNVARILRNYHWLLCISIFSRKKRNLNENLFHLLNIPHLGRLIYFCIVYVNFATHKYIMYTVHNSRKMTNQTEQITMKKFSTSMRVKLWREVIYNDPLDLVWKCKAFILIVLNVSPRVFGEKGYFHLRELSKFERF